MAEGASTPDRDSEQVAAMAEAWARGERVTAAELLADRPDVGPEAAIRLIYEETCLRREAGLHVDTSEVVRRHPRWGEQLRDLLDCDRLIRDPGPPVELPGPGEALGPFVLLEELGRGASGRTFLAADPGLADRPVVVKVVSDEQDEHLALAPLRHTHIVPLFSEHTFPDRGLRVLCMPYLGGASLAEILEGLAEVAADRRSGARIVEILGRRSRPVPGPPAPAGPFRRGLEAASYADAVAWIAACLADALHHAHARGVVHMDVKPSNVLVAADGQPMLLDFHLARAPIAAGERVSGRLGGTPGWMAPEQQAAMRAVEDGLPAPAAVDGRADVFALGLLLREALGIDPESGRPPIGVGLALADVVRKCLAPAPRDRYADAATLADDLRRQLDDLPLRGVRNRDPVELWRKWRRRHPGAFAWGVAVAMAAAALGVAGATFYGEYARRVDRVRAGLDAGSRDLRAGRFDEADRTLRDALEESRPLPAVGPLRTAIEGEIRLIRRGRLAKDVHALAEVVRSQHGVELPDGEGAARLAQACRATWERRGALDDAPGVRLTPEAEAGLRADLIELATVLTDVLARRGDAGRSEAIEVLDDAAAAFGPSYGLDARRARLAGEGDAGRPPRAAWEHDDRGRFLLREGRIREAAESFRQALDLRPQDFWPNYYAGVCAFRLRDFAEAAAAFQTCAALRPDAALGPFNRGRALEAMGRGKDAYRDYSRAIELDPSFAQARLDRGVLSYRAGRAAEAVGDFERGVRAAPDRATLGKLRHNLALARRSLGDQAGARADAEEAARLGVPEARALLDGPR